MKVTGIIAEYNPFHNGHAYQIRQIKEQLHSDYVIVVMSGDFVQRGEPAVVDKYTRAKMALLLGADLILELPVLFSCASASYFALGGTALLDGLGCVDHLCFGTEAGTAADFNTAASVLKEEPKEFRILLNEGLKKGMSFPAARKEAYCCYTGKNESLLDSPNSLLGLEYTKALLTLNSSIRPEPILRKGSDYHDPDLHEYASASAIRKQMLQDPSMTSILQSSCIPKEAMKVLFEEGIPCHVMETKDFSSMFAYVLLRCGSPEELSRIFDVSTVLANRIWNYRDQYRNMDQFAELLKTRNETLLHMKRSLLHILLALSDPSEEELLPCYTRVLGMKKESAALLRKIREKGTIPVITKMAASEKLLTEFYDDRPEYAYAAIQQLKQTTFASNLYQRQFSLKGNTPYRHENTRQFPVL